jgi:hypothetical protein
MSTLRISHHNRSISALSGAGDSARTDSSGDGASFASALGVAGLAPKDASAALLGGKSGDSSGDPATPRKQSGGQGTLDSVAASLAAQGSLAPVSEPASPHRRSPGRDQADDAALSLAAEASVSGQGSSNLPGTAVSEPRRVAALGASATSASSVPASGSGWLATTATNTSATSVASVPASDSTAAASNAPGSSDDIVGRLPANLDRFGATVATTDDPNNANASADASQLDARPVDANPPSPEIAAVSAGVARQNAAPGTRQVLSNRTAAAPAVSNDAGTASPAGTGAGGETATPAAVSGLAHAPTADGLAVGWTATDPTGGAVADAGPVLPALAPAASTAPHIGTSSATSVLAGVLPQILPSTGSGQTGTTGSGIAAADGVARGRFTPLGATSDAGNPAAAAVGDSGAPAPVASAAGASASDPTPTATASVSDQVAGQLVRLVSSGSRDMVMRLRPPELGDLTVRVAVSGRDVSAWFASPQPEVQSAITAAMGQLQTSLGDAGYNLNGAWVGADGSNAGQQGANPSPLPAARSLAAASSPGLSAAIAPQPAASGLNIYV